MQMGAYGIVVFALGLGACGGDVKPQSKTSASLTNEVPCTKESCPPVRMEITTNPNQGGGLIAQMGISANWEIIGTAIGGATRDIRMKAYNPPKGAPFQGQGTTKISMRMRGLEPMQAQAPINVVIRDVSRCMHEFPAQAPACSNLDQKGLDQFEAKSAINWAVVEGNIDNLVDPTFTGDPGAPVGANAGVLGCARGLMTGALPGMLGGGGPMSAMMGGVTGCLGNSLGGLATPVQGWNGSYQQQPYQSHQQQQQQPYPY